MALESLGHCEYAMKAGFHLNPKAIEASLQVNRASDHLPGVAHSSCCGQVPQADGELTARLCVLWQNKS